MGTRLTIDSLTCLLANEHDPSRLLASSPGKLVRYLVADGERLGNDQPYAEVEASCHSVSLLLWASPAQLKAKDLQRCAQMRRSSKPGWSVVWCALVASTAVFPNVQKLMARCSACTGDEDVHAAAVARRGHAAPRAAGGVAAQCRRPHCQVKPAADGKFVPPAPAQPQLFFLPTHMGGNPDARHTGPSR